MSCPSKTNIPTVSMSKLFNELTSKNEKDGHKVHKNDTDKYLLLSQGKESLHYRRPLNVFPEVSSTITTQNTFITYQTLFYKINRHKSVIGKANNF